MIIGSVSENSGKTLITSFLLFEGSARGKKGGYIKALGVPGEKSEDSDVLSLREALENIKAKSAWLMQPHEEEKFIAGEINEDPLETLRRVYREMKENSDFVVIEAPQGPFRGAALGLDVVNMAHVLEEDVLLIERGDEPFLEDRVVWAGGVLGARLAGVIINKVPAEKMQHIEKTAVPFFRKKDIRVFGFVPYQRSLSGVRLRELVEVLGGEVIVGKEALDEIVTGVHVGALPHERALSRYRKNPNWVVVVSGSRTESIAAALEAKVKGIIVTGGIQPGGAVIAHAESEGIPVILVPEETMKVSEVIDRLLSKSSILQTGGIEEVADAFRGRIDVDAVFERITLE